MVGIYKVLNTNNNMENSLKITLAILGTIIFIFLAGTFTYLSLNTETQTITANGLSEVKSEPDLISVYFNVETIANTSTKAKDENSEIVDNVITEIIKLGFERDDITTENFNIRKNYEWAGGEREMKGYIATHNIKVKLPSERKDDVGEVIDVGVNAGANINYINFELTQSKQNELKREALRKATEDARLKAESIAQGLNKNLGDIVSVESQDFGYSPWPVYRGMDTAEAKKAATNINPSDKTITGRVNVVYSLE